MMSALPWHTWDGSDVHIYSGCGKAQEIWDRPHITVQKAVGLWVSNFTSTHASECWKIWIKRCDFDKIRLGLDSVACGQEGRIQGLVTLNSNKKSSHGSTLWMELGRTDSWWRWFTWVSSHSNQSEASGQICTTQPKESQAMQSICSFRLVWVQDFS
jgi:hypothetical protein